MSGKVSQFWNAVRRADFIKIDEAFVVANLDFTGNSGFTFEWIHWGRLEIFEITVNDIESGEWGAYNAFIYKGCEGVPVRIKFFTATEMTVPI